MQNKNFFIITIIFVITQNYLMEIEEKTIQNNFFQILFEYNKTANQFQGFNFQTTISQNNQLAIPSENKNIETHPIINFFGLKNFPHKSLFNDNLFSSEKDKWIYTNGYCKGLENLFQQIVHTVKINNGKISGIDITNCVLHRSTENNEKVDDMLINIQKSALTNLPKCFSEYNDCQYKNRLSLSERQNKNLMKLYNWRHYFYNTLNLDIIYQDQLQKCNDILPEMYLDDPQIIKILLELNIYCNHINLITIQDKNKDIEAYKEEHKAKTAPLYTIQSLLLIELIFYESFLKNHKDDNLKQLFNAYSEKMKNLLSLNIFLGSQQVALNNQKSLNDDLFKYTTLTRELIELHKKMKTHILHYKLKRYIRIQQEDEEVSDYNKKPFYTGAFAHISTGYSYNNNEQKFQPIENLMTGIVHSAGISFETNQSPWYNYYNKTNNNEELYNDINRRIFDIFGAAFELAKRNNKNTLYIKMPYIGLGNFLKLYKDEPMEYFVSSFYFQSFINNFEYFFKNKSTYNIDQFTIFFGDGDTIYNGKNKALLSQVNTYIDKNNLEATLITAFKNNFKTDIETVDTFNIKGIDLNDTKNSLCVFVRAGDEYANYLNGGMSDQSLERKWLGLPVYGAYPEIIFPEIIATAPLTPLLALELSKNNINTNKAPEQKVIINKYAYNKNNIQKAINDYALMNSDLKSNINECLIKETEKLITLCNISNFVSASLAQPNANHQNFERNMNNDNENQGLDIFFDFDRFSDCFWKILTKLNTTINNAEIIIDIDNLLNKFDSTSMKANTFKKLIRETIEFICKKKHCENIKFKYTHYVKLTISNIKEQSISKCADTKAIILNQSAELESYNQYKDRIIDKNYDNEYIKTISDNIITLQQEYDNPHACNKNELLNKIEQECADLLTRCELNEVNNKNHSEEKTEYWNINFNDLQMDNKNNGLKMTTNEYLDNITSLEQAIEDQIQKNQNVKNIASDELYQKLFFDIIKKYINCTIYINKTNMDYNLVKLPINSSIKTYIVNEVKDLIIKHHENEKWQIITKNAHNVFQKTYNPMKVLTINKEYYDRDKLDFLTKFKTFIDAHTRDIIYNEKNDTMHKIDFYGCKSNDIKDELFKLYYKNRDPSADKKQTALLNEILEIIQKNFKDIFDNASIIYPQQYNYERVKNMYQLKVPVYIGGQAINRTEKFNAALWNHYCDDDIITKNKINNKIYEEPTIPAFVSGLFPWYSFNNKDNTLEKKEDKLGIIFAHAVNFESKKTVDYKNYLDQNGNIQKDKIDSLKDYIQNITDTIIYSGIELTKKANKKDCYFRIPLIGLGQFKLEYKDTTTTLESLYLSSFKKSFDEYSNLKNNNITIYIDFFNFDNNKIYTDNYNNIFTNTQNTFLHPSGNIFNSKQISKNVLKKQDLVQTIIVHAGDGHSGLGNRGYYDNSLERQLLGYMNNDYLTPAHTLNILLQYFFLSEDSKNQRNREDGKKQINNQNNNLFEQAINIIKEDINKINLDNYKSTEEGKKEFTTIETKIDNIYNLMSLSNYYKDQNQDKNQIFAKEYSALSNKRDNLANLLQQKEEIKAQEEKRNKEIKDEAQPLDELINEYWNTQKYAFYYSTQDAGSNQVTAEIVKNIEVRLNNVINGLNKELYNNLKFDENKKKFKETVEHIKDYIKKTLPQRQYKKGLKINIDEINKNWYDPKHQTVVEISTTNLLKQEEISIPQHPKPEEKPEKKSEENNIKEIPYQEQKNDQSQKPKKSKWHIYLGSFAGLALLIAIFKYRNSIYEFIENSFLGKIFIKNHHTKEI